MSANHAKRNRLFLVSNRGSSGFFRNFVGFVFVNNVEVSTNLNGEVTATTDDMELPCLACRNGTNDELKK